MKLWTKQTWAETGHQARPNWRRRDSVWGRIGQRWGSIQLGPHKPKQWWRGRNAGGGCPRASQPPYLAWCFCPALTPEPWQKDLRNSSFLHLQVSESFSEAATGVILDEGFLLKSFTISLILLALTWKWFNSNQMTKEFKNTTESSKKFIWNHWKLAVKRSHTNLRTSPWPVSLAGISGDNHSGQDRTHRYPLTRNNRARQWHSARAH